MFNIIHTADIHFGMENYGKIDQNTGIHSRLLDFKKAFDCCIEYALHINCDLFIFAGDAYKTANPSPTQQKLLLDSFLRLLKHNIPVIIIVGNHDNPLSFGKAHSLDIFNQIPSDSFHVISRPRALKLQTKSGPIQIVGIPWPTRNTISLNNAHMLKSAQEITQYLSKAVATIIKKTAEKLDKNTPSILTGHITVSSGIFSGSEKRAIYGTDPILLPTDLAIEPFDYVALGHLHRYQDLNPHGYPAVVYSGSIERIDFGERKEEKGFCHITIPAKNQAQHRFVPIKTRPFVQITIKIQPDKNQTEQVIREIKHHNIQNAVVKIVCHLDRTTQNRLDKKGIGYALRDAWHIAGIHVIQENTTRQHRSVVQPSMQLKELLDIYFSGNPALAKRKNALIKMTLQLKQEVEQQATEADQRT